MKKIYLVPLTNNQLPESLKDCCYIHVKMNNLGQLGIIISEHELPYEWMLESTAQETLDAWIDTENESAELDENGYPILQSYINLGLF